MGLNYKLLKLQANVFVTIRYMVISFTIIEDQIELIYWFLTRRWKINTVTDRSDDFRSSGSSKGMLQFLLVLYHEFEGTWKWYLLCNNFTVKDRERPRGNLTLPWNANRSALLVTYLAVEDQTGSMSLATSIPGTFLKMQPAMSMPRRGGRDVGLMIYPPIQQPMKRISMGYSFPPGRALLLVIAINIPHQDAKIRITNKAAATLPDGGHRNHCPTLRIGEALFGKG